MPPAAFTRGDFLLPGLLVDILNSIEEESMLATGGLAQWYLLINNYILRSVSEADLISLMCALLIPYNTSQIPWRNRSIL